MVLAVNCFHKTVERAAKTYILRFRWGCALPRGCAVFPSLLYMLVSFFPFALVCCVGQPCRGHTVLRGDCHVINNVICEVMKTLRNTNLWFFCRATAVKKSQVRNEVEEINQFTNTPPEFTFMPTDQLLIKQRHFIQYNSYTS